MAVNGDDVLKVTAKMTWKLDTEVQNVYYVTLGTGSTVLDDEALDDMAAWMEAIYSILDNSITDDLSFDTIEVYNVTQDHAIGEVGWPTLTVGLSTGESLPPGVAAVATAYTGQKRTRGRKFFGPLTENNQDGGEWSGGTVADLTLATLEWITAFTGGTSGEGWLPGVIDKIGVFLPFVSAVVRGIVGYQRRRKPGVGS